METERAGPSAGQFIFRYRILSALETLIERKGVRRGSLGLPLGGRWDVMHRVNSSPGCLTYSSAAGRGPIFQRSLGEAEVAKDFISCDRRMQIGRGDRKRLAE